MDKVREARKLAISAALDCTRLKARMRRACMDVLLHGATYAAAGARIGATRMDVYRAVKRARAKLIEVEHYIAGIK